MKKILILLGLVFYQTLFATNVPVSNTPTNVTSENQVKKVHVIKKIFSKNDRKSKVKASHQTLKLKKKLANIKGGGASGLPKILLIALVVLLIVLCLLLLGPLLSILLSILLLVVLVLLILWLIGKI